MGAPETAPAPKSGHERFVHSRGDLGLFLGGYALDRRCDLGSIIELGEFVLPETIFLQILLDVLHQVAEAFPFVVPCTLVVHIAERPLNRISTWTIGWQPEQGKLWMGCQPLLDGFGFMNTLIIDNHIHNQWC